MKFLQLLVLISSQPDGMTQFSYMMLRLYGRGNFTLESEMAKQNFESQAVEKLMAVKSILPNMDRMLWKCDPNVPNERLTFEKLTMLQVFQSQSFSFLVLEEPD